MILVYIYIYKSVIVGNVEESDEFFLNNEKEKQGHVILDRLGRQRAIIDSC